MARRTHGHRRRTVPLKRADWLAAGKGECMRNFRGPFPLCGNRRPVNVIEDVFGRPGHCSSRMDPPRLCGRLGFGRRSRFAAAASMAAMSRQVGRSSLRATTFGWQRQHYKTVFRRLAGWRTKVRHCPGLVGQRETVERGDRPGRTAVSCRHRHARLALPPGQWISNGSFLPRRRRRAALSAVKFYQVACLKERRPSPCADPRPPRPIRARSEWRSRAFRDLSIIANTTCRPPSLSALTSPREDTVTIRDSLALREPVSRRTRPSSWRRRIQDLDKLENSLSAQVP